eukprot:7269383-Lingulodinium_polyedra.AAC.1
MATMACADLAAGDGRPNAYLQSFASMGNNGKPPADISKDSRNFVDGADARDARVANQDTI